MSVRELEGEDMDGGVRGPPLVLCSEILFLFEFPFKVEAGRDTMEPPWQTIHQLTEQRAVHHRLHWHCQSRVLYTV